MAESSTAESCKNVTEEELLELAKKELLRDIKCASVRAEQFGAHSWAKPQKFIPNRRFLRHMLVNASRVNLRKDEKMKNNKSSRITSAAHRKSHKRDNRARPKKDKTHRKRSRWDSSPEHVEARSHQKKKDKEKRHHHPVKTKEKRSK